MKAIGIILAGGNNNKLGALTKPRISAAIPIASSYRVIDFTLSNMTNSGIRKVAVMTQYNSRSLNNHLASSKWWNFGRKRSSLFVFTPYFNNDNSIWFRGTADSIYQNISFLERSKDEFVVITNGDGVYKMDYNEVINYHKEKEAHITVVCRDMKEGNLSKYGVMKLNDDNRILEYEEKPLDTKNDVISLAIYVIRRELLIQLLKDAHNEGRHDFVQDIVIRQRRVLRIYGFKYNENSNGELNYWSPINDVESYYKTNMDFLERDVREYFTKNTSSVLTKPKDEPPVKYNFAANVKNCIIGNGSIISGAVINSVLFRKITVGEKSEIKNSIVLEGCKIGSGCILENVILDKNVIVEDGARVIGEVGKPTIIGKGEIIKA